MQKCGLGSVGYRHTISAAVGALTLLLSGCMVGPNYHKPSVPAAPAFQEPAAPAPIGPSEIAYGDWWKFFHAPLLDSLETQADGANKDIKIAIAHVDEASASTSIAR